MKLEVVNNLCGFVGKPAERKKIETTLADFHRFIYGRPLTSGQVFDNGDDDLIDLAFHYDRDEYTVDDLKFKWREFKKQ